MAVINAGALDFIPFSENRSTVTNPAHVEETIAFVDIAACTTHVVGVSETIPLVETGHESSVEAGATDTLSLSEVSARGPTASAFDLFGMVDFAGKFHGGNVPDTITLTEVASQQKTKLGHDTLSIVEVADNAINRFLTISESLGLYEDAIGILESCSPTDLRVAITLSYPATGYSLELCSAEFGDIQHRDLQRINRRSRANDLIIYRDPTWTRADHITLRLSKLTEGKKAALLNFLEFTTGHIVRLTDYENNVWEGFVMNPNTPISGVGTCQYSCELQFSGGIVING